MQCNVAIQQYMHAQQTSGLVTVSMYDVYMVPAAMCPTNMCYLPLALQVQNRVVQPMLCGLGRNISRYRHLA